MRSLPLSETTRPGGAFGSIHLSHTNKYRRIAAHLPRNQAGRCRTTCNND